MELSEVLKNQETILSELKELEDDNKQIIHMLRCSSIDKNKPDDFNCTYN